MSLYLCVFAEGVSDTDLDGIDVGGYDDFGRFREVVHQTLESDGWGSRFPTLLEQSDSRGEWSPAACLALQAELQIIRDELALQPPLSLDGWQAQTVRSLGLVPSNAVNVDQRLGGVRGH